MSPGQLGAALFGVYMNASCGSDKTQSWAMPFDFGQLCPVKNKGVGFTSPTL